MDVSPGSSVPSTTLAAEGCDQGRRERLAGWLIRRLGNLREVGRKLLRPGSFVIGALVVVYAAEQLAKNQDFPEGAWNPGTFGSSVLVVTGVAAGIGYFLMTIAFNRLLKRTQENERLQSICRDIARIVCDEGRFPHPEVSVHVWTVVGPPGLRYMRRRSVFLSGTRRALTDTWRKTKGPVGMCWQTEKPFVADIEALDDRSPDEATFCAIDPDDRFHMTWTEFLRTRASKAIWVEPLFGGPPGAGGVRGCLAVDVRIPRTASELERVVEERRDDLDAQIDVCEKLLAD